MIRNLKALGLALVAVFAMSAIAASAASALEFTATNGNYPVKFSGTQPAAEPHAFTADGFTTECKVAEFNGTQKAKSSTSSATPTYKECEVAGSGGFLSATVTMNGCEYVFDVSGGANATVDLVCPAGKDVTIDAGSCVIHIAPFENKSHVNMSNNKPHIDAKPTVSGIHAVLTDAFLCPFEGNTTTTTGTLTGGPVTLKGENEGIDVG